MTVVNAYEDATYPTGHAHLPNVLWFMLHSLPICHDIIYCNYGRVNVSCHYITKLSSVLWCCWLGVRKGIRPIKNLSVEVLAWLSVWSEVQMICTWSSWCHWHLIISCFIKTRNGLPCWCQLHVLLSLCIWTAFGGINLCLCTLYLPSVDVLIGCDQLTDFLHKMCFSGKMAQPYVAPYSSSKFALDGFFSALRQELYIDDIDVSVTICYIGLTGWLSMQLINNLKQRMPYFYRSIDGVFVFLL